jgi:hypothetical protein
LPTQWGKGIYFAEDAAYSKYFASPADPQKNDLQPDERQMMLASVILGNTVEMDRDNPQMAYRLGGRKNSAYDSEGKLIPAINAPPFLDSKPPLYKGGSGAKYNTITGFTQLDLQQRDKYGRTAWTKNPDCPRSRVW